MYEGQINPVDLLVVLSFNILHLDSKIAAASDARVEARKLCAAARSGSCLLDVESDHKLVDSVFVGADADALDGSG